MSKEQYKDRYYPPKFKEGQEVHDGAYGETFEYKHSRDYMIQGRLIAIIVGHNTKGFDLKVISTKIDSL
jgi:hypothetical protein